MTIVAILAAEAGLAPRYGAKILQRGLSGKALSGIEEDCLGKFVAYRSKQDAWS
jgi:hypothetical protein